jgi:hypothetical protein
MAKGGSHDRVRFGIRRENRYQLPASHYPDTVT